MGSTWLEANRVLKALITGDSGKRAASSSALDEVVSISGPVAANEIRLETSMIGLPLATVAISAAISDRFGK